MSGFAVCESIKVLTQNGECEIELCLGDITKLTQEEKVDVLIVSAFSEDYAPTPTSVIGALQRNLDLSVGDLALDKEEDLRQLYSCWWSKPLPSHLPYKRLLCFETDEYLSVPQVMIGDVFRCLVSILKNEGGSVVTPLLNTGDQGYERDEMMAGMIEAAVRWMKAGLPLRKLKIVLYASRVEGDAKAAVMLSKYRIALRVFEQMKEKYDMQYMLPKEVPLEYDIYLSYSEADENIVHKIQEKLKKNKEDVRIFSTRQQLDETSFWQEDMYKVMMKSAKVIAVLSPNYLQSTACIEQYNIALCCNRQTHRDVLAPFYVETVQNLPTYMKLVQSIECRPQDEDSINNACYQVIVSLSVNFTRSVSLLNPIVIQYDLFISYSHKDMEIAQKMVKMLKDLNPELKVFFDVLEIKTGKSWQRAMYHSIDGSRCLVALITNNYMQSAVCQEEFNLAMMKHYAKGKHQQISEHWCSLQLDWASKEARQRCETGSQTNSLQLIAFVIGKISCLPAGYEKIPQITTASSSLEDGLKILCRTLVTWLEKGELAEEESTYHEYFKNSEETKFEISEKWEALRRKHFEDKFPDWPSTLTDTFSQGQIPSLCDDTCDIVLSYHEDDEEYAEFMMGLLQQFAPKLNIQAKGKNEQERLTLIEEGKKIILLLSPSYIESPEQVEELHIAIWRSRLSPNLIFPIHLHTLPSRPAYFHLLPCQVNLNDSLWMELALKERVVLSAEFKEVVGGFSKPSEEIALYMAVFYLLEAVKQERMEGKPQLTSLVPALLNPFYLDRCIRKSDLHGNGQASNVRTNRPGMGICEMSSSPLLRH